MNITSPNLGGIDVNMAHWTAKGQINNLGCKNEKFSHRQ